jgi:four helix bundle protein
MEKKIASFRDLEVYQNTYKACIEVAKKIIPGIPDIERNDLKSQLRRSVKAIPRLIAEGYAKRHQKHGFQKYLDDAMGNVMRQLLG